MKRTVQLINSDGDLVAEATRDGEVLTVRVLMANDDEAIQALRDVLVPFAGHGWGTAYEKACILVPVSPKRRDKQ